ncbi:MAG TPA: hypothetical protein VFH83_04105 [Spirochaetia bacterium]|nr:hypothetical protein [Spirochaetia bacterium]
MQQISRPPETTPTAVESARQESDAVRTAPAQSGASPAYLAGPAEQGVQGGVGTRTPVIPVENDVEGSLQRASSELSRTPPAPTSEEMRRASDAYQAQAAAQNEQAQRREGDGTRTLDVMA